MRVVASVAVVGILMVTAVAGADPVNAPAIAAGHPVRLTPPPVPTIGGCRIFPTDNSWNVNIRNAPLASRSSQIISYIQAHGSDNLHPDFGENPAYGIPFVVVPQHQALVPITYDAYGDESDPARSRSRSTRPWRAAAQVATAMCWCSARARATCSSCTSGGGRGAGGWPPVGPAST
ncbi:MAG: hypothetical protein R2694_13805 [Ilumatobacteraceae bacterium]